MWAKEFKYSFSTRNTKIKFSYSLLLFCFWCPVRLFFFLFFFLSCRIVYISISPHYITVKTVLFSFFLFNFNYIFLIGCHTRLYIVKMICYTPALCVYICVYLGWNINRLIDLPKCLAAGISNRWSASTRASNFWANLTPCSFISVDQSVMMSKWM